MELGFETARLKTGTPARVDARTVDFSGLQAQPGDPDTRWFSFDPEARALALLNVAFAVSSLCDFSLSNDCCWHVAAAGRVDGAPSAPAERGAFSAEFDRKVQTCRTTYPWSWSQMQFKAALMRTRF